MSVNSEVLNTLRGVIPDVYPDFYEGNKRKYITFNIEGSNATDYADDTPQNEEVSLQIHIYVDEPPLKFKKAARKALFDAGFGYPVVDLITYEKDTGLYHIALSCSKIYENDLKEE